MQSRKQVNLRSKRVETKKAIELIQLNQEHFYVVRVSPEMPQPEFVQLQKAFSGLHNVLLLDASTISIVDIER